MGAMESKGLEAYNHLSQAMNVMADRMIRDGFLEGFRTEHPTLQQKTFGLFLRAIFQLAESEYVDARNEASVEAARRIRDLFDGQMPPLPFI